MDDQLKNAYLEFFSNKEVKDQFEGDLELDFMLEELKSGNHYKDEQLTRDEYSQAGLNFKRRTMGYKAPFLHSKKEYYYEAYQYAGRYNFKNSLDRYICTAYALGLTHQRISDIVKAVHERTGIWKPVSRSTVQRIVARFNRKLRLFLDSRARGLRDVKAREAR